MSLKDFTGTKKYKAALPIFILLNFLIITLGDYLIPSLTKVYLTLMFGYALLRSFHNSASIALGAWKGLKVLDKIK